jgi:hypothetical protein
MYLDIRIPKKEVTLVGRETKHDPTHVNKKATQVFNTHAVQPNFDPIGKGH